MGATFVLIQGLLGLPNLEEEQCIGLPLYLMQVITHVASLRPTGLH